MSLFSSQRILLAEGGELELCEGWCAPHETKGLFARLMDELPWKQEWITIAGRDVAQPRLSAWIGDPTAIYRYSGRSFVPSPWTPTTTALRDRLAEEKGSRFNSVLANLYRDGQDSMGSHADDEPELGDEPVIASLSLGATRTLFFHARTHSVARVDIPLTDGALLWMRGSTQRHWRHQIPKTRRAVGPRINLTFRHIVRTGER